MKQIKYLALIASTFLYVGCGGGSGSGGVSGSGGSSTPSKLAIDTNAKAISYKAKNGDWKSIDVNSGAPAIDGLKEYIINKDDKFMVALKCSNKESFLIAFSKDDGDIKFKCPITTIAFNKTLKGALDDTITVSEKGFITAIGTKSAFDFSSPFKYSYSIEQGLYDLISVSIDSASKPARFYIKRGINLNQNKTLNISMNGSNSCAIKSKNFTAGTGFRIVYISKGNTYFQSNSGGKWYYPNCIENSNDIYTLVGKDSTGNKISLKVRDANSIAKADIGAQDITHINSLTQLAYQNSGQVSGLSQYIPNSNSPKLRAFLIDTKNASNQRYNMLLSKNFLDNDDVFDLPKLSTINGFNGMWDGNNATAVDTVAIMSDTKVSNILKGKMLYLHEINTFVTDNCKIEFSKQKVK